MRVFTRATKTGEAVELGQLDVVAVETAGVRIQVHHLPHDTHATIRVDPIGVGFIARLDVAEMSANQGQAALVVRGRRASDRALLVVARNEVEKTRDRLVRGMDDPAAETEDALTKLSAALRELEEMS